MKALGYLFLIPASILNAILRGYVLVTLWAWFIVSQFPQMPHLTIVTAMGLVITVGLLRSHGLTDKETKELLSNDHESLSLAGRWIQVATYAVVSLITLFSGWIWHHFM